MTWTTWTECIASLLLHLPQWQTALSTKVPAGRRTYSYALHRTCIQKASTTTQCPFRCPEVRPGTARSRCFHQLKICFHCCYAIIFVWQLSTATAITLHIFFSPNLTLLPAFTNSQKGSCRHSATTWSPPRAFFEHQQILYWSSSISSSTPELASWTFGSRC